MTEPSGLSGPGESEPAAPAWQATKAEPTDTTWRDNSAEYAAGSLVDAAPPDPGLAPGGRRNRARRVAAVGSLIALGICGVGGGGTLLASELTRSPTSGQASAAAAQEVATRWQRLAAGQIFPATVQYLDAESITQAAHRVGIAPSASCQAGLDPAVLGAIRGLGCAVVLRATYADQSGTLIATIGAAVLPSPHAAAAAVARLTGRKPRGGVQPVGFTGTISDLFARSRQPAFGTPVASGPYVFLYAAGYADGEPGSAGSNPDLASLGQGLVVKVDHILTSHGKPCAMKDIRC